MSKKKVIILGGGIGGLSAAHALSKHADDFDITIIEQNHYLGGQATENIIQNSDNTSLICWHVITNQHKYFLSIINEICDTSGKKIILHLKIINKLIYCLQNHNHPEYNNSAISKRLQTFNLAFESIYKKKISKKDKYILYKIYLYATLISEEHLANYDNVLWKTYINKLSTDVKQWVLYYTSIYLNMDYNKVSVYFIFKILRNKGKKINTSEDVNKFYIFDDNITNILFIPWQKHLEQQGVKILLNHSVNRIYHTAPLNTISTIHVKHEQNELILTADIFINALNIQNLANLYPLSNKFMELYKSSKYIQIKILFYLPYQARKKDTHVKALIMPLTKWFVCVRLVEELWESERCNYIMCSIGIWDKPGINKKNAEDCDRRELAVECWQQLISTHHNLCLSTQMPKWGIWDNFQFNNELNEIDSVEPRFSNNANIQYLRPDYVDKNILNLYHATAYTKTTANIYNMESAAEAGIKTAKIICAKKNSTVFSEPINNNKKSTRRRITRVTQVCRIIDKYVYKFTNYFK